MELHRVLEIVARRCARTSLNAAAIAKTHGQTHMNIFSLSKKSALITGGTAGIGLATARQFIAAGATVIITGRRKSGAQTAKDLGARFIRADLSSGEEIAALFAQIQTLDILVNNAGIYVDD